MSDKLSQDKEIVKLEKKLAKDGQETFISETRGMNEAQLEDRMLALAKANQDNITAKKDDEALQNAKEVVRDLAAPYNEFKRKNEEKMRFVSLVLTEKTE